MVRTVHNFWLPDNVLQTALDLW